MGTNMLDRVGRVELVRGMRGLVRGEEHRRSSVQKEIFHDLWHAVERVLNYSNSIVKVKHILARMISMLERH